MIESPKMDGVPVMSQFANWDGPFSSMIYHYLPYQTWWFPIFHSSVTLEGTVLKWSAIQRIHWYTDGTYSFQGGLKTGNPLLGTSQKPQGFKHPSDMGISSTRSGLMMNNDWYCNILKILKKILKKNPQCLPSIRKKRRTFLSDWKWRDFFGYAVIQQMASRLCHVFPESSRSPVELLGSCYRPHPKWSPDTGDMVELEASRTPGIENPSLRKPRSKIRIIVEGMMRSRLQKCSETRKHLEIVTWWLKQDILSSNMEQLSTGYTATPTQPKHGIDISRPWRQW